MQITPFLSCKEVWENSYFHSVFYFSPHKIVNALMHSPQSAAQNI